MIRAVLRAPSRREIPRAAGPPPSRPAARGANIPGRAYLHPDVWYVCMYVHTNRVWGPTTLIVRRGSFAGAPPLHVRFVI